MDERLVTPGPDGAGLTTLSTRFCVFLLATSLFVSFALGFRPSIYPFERGLDASYLFAANHASVHGKRWGRDFVSTFGPYSYVIHAFDLGSTPLRKRASEWFLVALVGASAALYGALGTVGRRRSLLVALLLIWAVHIQLNEERWFLLSLLLLLVSVRGTGRYAAASLLTASLLAGFFLLMKLSLGVGAILTMAVGAFLTRRPKTILSRVGLLLLGGAVGFSLGWLGQQGTLQGIPAFFDAAEQIVSGYSSAMSVAPAAWEVTALYLVYFGLVLAIACLGSGNSLAVLTLAACATPLFIAWKHAMVRQDAAHVRIFVLMGVFVVCVLLKDFLAAGFRKSTLFLAVTVPPLLAIWFFPGTQADRSVGGLLSRLATPFEFPGIMEAAAPPMESPPPPALLERLRLSEEARELVGDHPVDVYPWESVYVAANHLNWANRPSPASFGTYTPELDRANQEFLSSSRRPRFVLWHKQPTVYSIDDRHLFWDEPLTLRTILSSYRLVRDDSVFLLEALPRPTDSDPVPLRIVEAGWDEWIPVPPSEGAILAAVDFETPFGILVRKLVLREDPMFLSVRFSPDDERTYRLVPAQARSGLWVSPLPRSLNELSAILEGDLGRPRVEAIKFHAKRDEGDTFTLSWLRVPRLP